jgi:hypothetical protein
MLRALNIRRLVLSGVLALGLLGALGASAPAAHAGHCQPAYVDVWVTLYETRLQSYQVCATKYDHCGRPYHVYQTAYKTVQVPVKKLVRVYR